MDYAVPFFLFLSMAGINAYKTGRHSLCGPNERPVNGRAQHDTFCKSQITPRYLLFNSFKCVCRSGFVRNSWGECITNEQCRACARMRNKDYGLCISHCPVVCGQRFNPFCRPGCTAGCGCPPDYALDGGRCVSTRRCPPKCPNNSHYSPCLDTCAPSCDGKKPIVCVTACNKGGCVCNPGYSSKWTGGTQRCILTSRCSYVK